MQDYSSSNSNGVKCELLETPEKQCNAGREKVSPEKKRSYSHNLIEEEVIDIVDSDEEGFEEFHSTLGSGEISSEFDGLEDDRPTLFPEIGRDHASEGCS